MHNINSVYDGNWKALIRRMVENHKQQKEFRRHFRRKMANQISYRSSSKRITNRDSLEQHEICEFMYVQL